MRVSVRVNSRSHITRHGDPNDRWDGDDTSESIDSVEAVLVDGDTKAYEFYGHNPAELDVKPGDMVYSVIVRYSTGDTFHREDGRYSVMDTFKTESEALELQTALEAVDIPYSSGKSIPYDIELFGKSYNVPWFGYFESLESVDVYELRVNGSRDKPRGKIVRW